MKTIRIAVKGHSVISLDSLIEYQGELKSLAKEDYERLKTSILELGFTSPFHLWLHPDGKWRVLDGHQRLRVLKNMRDKEAYIIPELPIVEVQAENEEQAKKILLALASQYGKLEGQGLYQFMADSKISLPEVERLYRFPEIKYKQFKYEFFKDLPKKEESFDEKSETNSSAKECPNCGYKMLSS